MPYPLRHGHFAHNRLQCIDTWSMTNEYHWSEVWAAFTIGLLFRAVQMQQPQQNENIPSFPRTIQQPFEGKLERSKLLLFIM